MQEKSHNLSTNLSGKNSFLNNWIELESVIYEK